jgi:riboflavin kinase / FMN adenylyltransferase
MTDVARAVRGLALDELPAIGEAAVTMGVFDGVHRGHRAMLDATRSAARSRGASAVALVFDPHPDEVIRPGTRVPWLAPLATNLRWIEDEAGIDHAVPIRFDADLQQLAPDEFLAGLAPAIGLRALVMSPESAFGRGRAGTVERMRELGAERGFEVVTVEPVLAGGEVISSGRIRGLVAGGAVEAAAALGRPPYLEGTVVVGDRRGRALGFPTANLAFDYTPALPQRGIYVGLTTCEERGVRAHPSLVSVGIRPTFHPDGELLVEAYLLDFDADLYGSVLELDLLARLRDEVRFDGPAALVEQMRRDEAAARRFLAAR